MAEVRIESRRVIRPTFRLPLRGVYELSQMVCLEGIESLPCDPELGAAEFRVPAVFRYVLIRVVVMA